MTKVRMSVAFADMTNFHKLMMAVGAERTIEVLQDGLRVVGDAILKHGGQIRKYIGDALFFTFPTPQQAIDAAQEIVKCQREIEGLSLRYHVAIATGQAVVTKIGHPSYLIEDIMGETVNRAALLLREAGKTETGIALCEETQRAIGQRE